MAQVTQQVRPWWDKTQMAIKESFSKEYIRIISYEKREDNWGDGEEKGEHNKILQKVTRAPAPPPPLSPLPSLCGCFKGSTAPIKNHTIGGRRFCCTCATRSY